MKLNEILLVCAALFPAIILCIYVFVKDRVEKEPVGLLFSLFLVGALTCYPAAEIEGVIFEFLDGIFKNFAVEQGGEYLLSDNAFKLYNVCKYFIGVALVEEGLKFAALLLLTRKNKNFNSLFDGLIYAVFVSLGFAALENCFYVLENGWFTALMRGLMSVPGHMFFAVMMGYYYSLWHMYESARQKERRLKESGIINSSAAEFSGKRYLALSLIVPVLVHGLYDYCCTAGTALSTISLYVLVILLYVFCFGKIKDMSKDDVDDGTFSGALLLKKYPFNKRNGENKGE